MIEELNKTVWAKIGISTIDGVGVIAIRDIPKGQRIYAQSFTPTFLSGSLEGVVPEIKEIILQRWPRAEEYRYLSPNDDARLLSFMNHSKESNYDPLTDCVTCDIASGEEITENYGAYAPGDN